MQAGSRQCLPIWHTHQLRLLNSWTELKYCKKREFPKSVRVKISSPKSWYLIPLLHLHPLCIQHSVSSGQVPPLRHAWQIRITIWLLPNSDTSSAKMCVENQMCQIQIQAVLKYVLKIKCAKLYLSKVAWNAKKMKLESFYLWRPHSQGEGCSGTVGEVREVAWK